MLNRRAFRLSGLAIYGAPARELLAAGSTLQNPKFSTSPFTLGIASGDPSPDGVVLWTRLAIDPLHGGGMDRRPVAVQWQIAADETMSEDEIERLAVELVRAARLFVPGTELEGVRRHVRLYRTHMNAHLRHHPTPFDGRVVYVSAEASQSPSKERMIEFWRKHSGVFELMVIPGRHHDILRPPNVEQLAARLKPLVALVDG